VKFRTSAKNQIPLTLLLLPVAKHRQNSASPILSEAFRFHKSVKTGRFQALKSRVAKFDRHWMPNQSASGRNLVRLGGGKCQKRGFEYFCCQCLVSLPTKDNCRWLDRRKVDRDNSVASKANPID
jgi:hypothetical protein